jgi:hypothetical protein
VRRRSLVLYAHRPVVKARQLTRTISFWTAVGGAALAPFPVTRPFAVFLWRICGLGGVGAVYGYWSASHGHDAEPVAFLRSMRSAPDRREGLVSAGWHAMFWVAAEVLRSRFA